MNMLEKIVEVTGLSRIRLAELLYEHGGFVDHASNYHLPDRNIPIWIEATLITPHSGDCTKEPWPCGLCDAQVALAQWDEFVSSIVANQNKLEN